MRKLDLCKRVGQLENAALSGWYVPSKTKYCKKTDRAQVVWTKDEKYSQTESEKRLNLSRVRYLFNTPVLKHGLGSLTVVRVFAFWKVKA